MGLTPEQRALVRRAFNTTDAADRRRIVAAVVAGGASVRVAAYPKEFLDAVENQEFHNPETDNKVKFVSLPPQEQTKVYEKWKAKGEQKPSGPTLDDVEVSAEVSEGARGVADKAVPLRAQTYDDIDEAHKAKKPWRVGLISESKSGGKTWEAIGNDGEIEIRFGPLGGWSQKKPFKGDVGKLWDRMKTKLSKGYDHMPSDQFRAYDGATEVSAKDLWKGLQKKYGDEPAKLAQATKALLGHLGEESKKRPKLKLDAVMDGIRQKYTEAAQAHAQKQEKKPEGPEMVDMTGQIMEGLKGMSEALKKKKTEKPKPKKKKKKPTFSQARDSAFSALEGAGWKVKRNLKTPKAEREIDGNKVVLQFKPQAVYMEVKGKAPSSSLHVDLRDVDPEEWIKTLADEAKKKLDLEAEVAAPPPKPKPKTDKGKSTTGFSDEEVDHLEDILKVLQAHAKSGPEKDRLKGVFTSMTGGTPLSPSDASMLLANKEMWDNVEKGLVGNKLTQEIHGKLKDLAGTEKKEAPKKPEKKKAPKKPEKEEAPKKPSGKHKDRKELRSKPKKKMTDSVKVSDELAGILIPDKMGEAAKAQAKKQLGGATFQLLSTLRDNAQHAVDDPGGAYAKALQKAGYSSEGIGKMHAALTKALTPALGRKYHPDVLSVANTHDLESEDADELAKFKGDKPPHGKKLNPQELFQKFLAKAAPETKKRMQGMPLDDFMAMYKAIMSDEEDEGGEAPKMASRLPQEPHSVVQDAFEEGVLAGDDNDVLAGEDEDAGGITIFDAPATVKKSTLSDEDRMLVRLARSTENRDLRHRVLKMLRGT